MFLLLVSLSFYYNIFIFEFEFKNLIYKSCTKLLSTKHTFENKKTEDNYMELPHSSSNKIIINS